MSAASPASTIASTIFARTVDIVKECIHPAISTALLYYANQRQFPFELQFALTYLSKDDVFGRNMFDKNKFTIVGPMTLINMFLNDFDRQMQLSRLHVWYPEQGIPFFRCLDMTGRLYLAAIWSLHVLNVVYPASLQYDRAANSSLSIGWLLVSVLIYKHFKPFRPSMRRYLAD
jgi:hypothetical protein